MHVVGYVKRLYELALISVCGEPFLSHTCLEREYLIWSVSEDVVFVLFYLAMMNKDVWIFFSEMQEVRRWGLKIG